MVALSLGTTQPAYADTWKQDQLAMAGLQNQLNPVAVAGAVVSVSDVVVITYSGNSHLVPGTVVDFALASGSGSSALPKGAEASPLRITIPASWANGSSVRGSTTIKFTAPLKAGKYTYVVKLNAAVVSARRTSLTGQGETAVIHLTVTPRVAATASPQPTPSPTLAPTAAPQPTPSPTLAPTASPQPTALPASGVLGSPSTFSTTSWSPLSDLGGLIWVLVSSPSHPSTVYAGTQGGIYKSTDAGLSWQNVSGGNPLLRDVRALAISPATENTVYALPVAGGAQRIFKTLDGGATWSALPTPNTFAGGSITIDPRDSQRIYVAGRELWFSSNGGTSWTTLPAGDGFRGLSIDPSNSLIQYSLANSWPSHVLKSTDGGMWWTSTDMLGGVSGNRVVVDPVTTARLYVTGVGLNGLLRSDNAGASWYAAGSGLPMATALAHTSPTRQVLALAFDPSNHNVLYSAPEDAGIYKSVDGGAHWLPSSTGLTNTFVFSIIALPGPQPILLAGTLGGVFRSTDHGATWAVANHGISAALVSSFAFSAQHPGTAYLGAHQADGVFRSTDSGATWAGLHDGLQGLATAAISAVLVDPTNDAVLYAGSDGYSRSGIYKSTDAGTTWKTAYSLPDGAGGINGFAISAAAPGTVYAAYADGVLKSTDAGATWKQLTGFYPTYVSAIAADPVNPGVLYATKGIGEGSGVYKSSDGGTTWRRLAVGTTTEAFRSVLIDSRDPRIVFAGSLGGLWKTTDSGQSWQRTVSGLPANVYVSAIVAHPNTAGTYFLGTAAWGNNGVPVPGAGVFTSVDGGRTWSALNQGLPVLGVNALGISPGPAPTLYVGTWYAGAYVRAVTP